MFLVVVCVRVQRTLCLSMCGGLLRRCMCCYRKGFALKYTFTLTVTATYEHRAYVLSCGGQLHCVISCLDSDIQLERGRQRRCGRKRQNRQAFYTEQAHDCISNTSAIVFLRFLLMCFTVLSHIVKQWVRNVGFALWSLFPHVKLLPHTHTHTRTHVLAVLSSLFTICTNGVFLKCFWSLRYKSERFV